jgi:hypothetical protein
MKILLAIVAVLVWVLICYIGWSIVRSGDERR